MDLRANNDNKNAIDSEMGAFEKFESEAKNTIFGIMFVVLKDYEVSIYFSAIMTFIQFVQLLIFPFHDTINSVWNSDKIVNVIHDIVNYVNIDENVKDTNWSLYITLFYVGVVFIAFSLILSILASYAFSRKKTSFTWPIITLRYTFGLFTTVLFYPILDYLFSMLACVNDPNTGQNVHSYFTDVVCWSSSHVAHAVIAIIMIIIFLSICAVVSLTYFEYKSTNNDPVARIHSRQYFLMLVYQTVMSICLTFLTGSEFQILLLALILIGSIILFVKFYFAYPFHNETMAKIWSILMAVNLWTAVMLVFAKIMENTLFEGSIIAWLLGIPFVVLIILTNRDPRIELLLINVNKFQSPQEVQDQIRYLLKMIEWQANKKNSAILLDGYIEIHKQSCNQEDCPLKQKNIKNSRFSKNLMSQDETMNEKYAVLIQLVYKMYTQAIKKFPNSTSLRIAYAFFLVEKMQSKQQALQELSQAEQNKPPVDEQFVIFRYKKIIEDEIAESQAEGQGGLDVVSEIAFQNHLRQLQANIEKSALLHMEFWSQLSEDNPDLSKLNDIGSKINSSVANVEDHWIKLGKINASNAKAVRLYGKYLIEIINDKEAGDNLLEKARNLSNTQTNKRAIQMIGAGGDDYSNEATPTVWVSGEQDKFGQITGINLTAASLFGYNKTELLSRKVNVLMPQLYAKHHDSFLDTYMNSGEGSLVGKNKERLVFGKNKSNYIFPVYYGLRVVQSIIQGTQFIATFRVEKNFKNAAYILTQPDGTIDSISSSAISLLKVDLKLINQKKGNIQDLIPNIIRDKQSMFTSTNAGRSLATVSYHYPKDSEYLLENDEASAQLHCYLYELIFLAGRENAGYQFRFERIIHKSGATADKNAKISNFQFRFEKNRASVIGEYAEGSTNTDYNSNTQEDEVLGGIQHSDQESDHEKEMMNSAQKSQPDEQEEVREKRVDYGVGIKTLRLMGGRPQEIEEERGEDDSDNEEGGEFSSSKESKEASQTKQQQQLIQQEEDAQEEGSYRDFSTTFKSRKALTAVINDKSLPSAIKTLRIVINVLGVVFLAIAITDYAIARNEFDKINTQIDLLDKSNSRLSEMMNALSKVRELTLINIGLLSDIYTDPSLFFTKLQTALDTAKSLKQDLEAQTWSLSDAHLALLNNPSITLVSLSSGTQTVGLTQAMEQIMSRGNSIVSTNLSLLTSNNADVYFMTYNLLNGFYQGLQLSSLYYAQELTDRVQDKGHTFLILLIASIVALVLAMLILFPILRQVNKTREEVLSLFLDIPEKTVKGLYTKCETFISNLQVGEDEDMISEIDDEELEKPQGEHETQDFIPRRRRKKFKNSGRSQNDFFIKFMIVVLILEAYFIFAYVSTALLLNDISTLIPEYNATSAAEPFFSFANNAERALFINPDFSNMSVLGQTSMTVATNNIVSMYDLDSFILEEHSINRKIHTDDYANTFNQIMMSTPCGYLTSLVPNATCAAFADQTVFQGMTVALSRHFENLRTLLSCASKIIGGTPANCTITPTTSVNVDPTNATLNLTQNLMRTTQALEISTMQFTYIKPTFRVLVDDFKQSLKDTFDSELTVRLAVFIVFIIVLVFIYIFLWQTIAISMSNEIWRTKSMLNMIPLSVIAKIKSIRLYLKRFWNDMNIAEA